MLYCTGFIVAGFILRSMSGQAIKSHQILTMYTTHNALCGLSDNDNGVCEPRPFLH